MDRRVAGLLGTLILSGWALAAAEPGTARACLDLAAVAGGLSGCEAHSAQAVPAEAFPALAEESAPQRSAVQQFPALAAVEPPAPRRVTAQEGDLSTGAINGAGAGFKWPFYGVLSPAIALLSEGFGRRMSRASDGSRSDNGNGGAYMAAGVALAVVLYVPALVLGLVAAPIGALAGMFAEKSSPGSTREWDPERVLS